VFPVFSFVTWCGTKFSTVLVLGELILFLFLSLSLSIFLSMSRDLSERMGGLSVCSMHRALPPRHSELSHKIRFLQKSSHSSSPSRTVVRLPCPPEFVAQTASPARGKCKMSLVMDPSLALSKCYSLAAIVACCRVDFFLSLHVPTKVASNIVVLR
jgi:hypothetical protein